MRSDSLRPLAAAALIAAFVVPPAILRSGPVLCPFRAVTGRPCPTCGLTRSWSSMAHLQVVDAASYHLLGPATFVAAAALVGVGDERAHRLLTTATTRPLLATLGTAWIGAWLWRIATGWRG